MPASPLYAVERTRLTLRRSLALATADEIRPDWEAKLASVKAVAARRANRRIVMRQVSASFCRVLRLL